MKTTPRTCFSRPEGDECHRNVLDHGYCYACQTYLCCMPECTEAVSSPATRCEFCHPLACPCDDCRGCRCDGCVAAGLGEDDSDGVPVPVGDEDTSAVRTVRIRDVSTDELAAEWIARIEIREAA